MIRRKARHHANGKYDITGTVHSSAIGDNSTVITGNVYNTRDSPQDAALKALREAVRNRCEFEHVALKLKNSQPMPVKWEMAGIGVSVDPSFAFRPSASPPAFDVRSDEPEAVAANYLALEHGRLIILGDAGSGKTVLAHQIQWELLSTSPESVPVVFTLARGNIDPDKTLKDWIVDSLKDDYPEIWSRRDIGIGVVEQLVRNNRILPILDGLDEVEPPSRASIVEHLNTNLTGAFILTCRGEVFAELVKQSGKVDGAAVIQSKIMIPAEVAEYLSPFITGEHANWSLVLDCLSENSNEAVVRVCTSPLGLWLLCAVYLHPDSDSYGWDVAHILDKRRFPDSDKLKTHLFESLIPSVLRHRKSRPEDSSDPFRARRTWNPRDARSWLTYLAQSLNGKTDIRWWHLYRERPQGNSYRNRLMRLPILKSVDFRSESPAAVVGWITGVLLLLSVGVYLAVAGTFSALSGFAPFLVLGYILVAEPLFKAVRRAARAIPGRIRITSRRPTPYLVHAFRQRRLGWRYLLGAAIFGAWGAMIAGNSAVSEVIGMPLTSSTLLRFLLLVPAGFVFGSLVASLHIVAVGVNDWIWNKHGGDDEHCPACAEERRELNRWQTPEISLQGSRKRFLTIFSGIVLFVAIAGISLAVSVLIARPGKERDYALLFLLTTGLPLLLTLPLALTTAVLAEAAWARFIVTSKWLALRSKVPWRTMAFLGDVQRVGLLRVEGSVYQFRHSELRDYLAPRESVHKSKDVDSLILMKQLEDADAASQAALAATPAIEDAPKTGESEADPDLSMALNRIKSHTDKLNSWDKQAIDSQIDCKYDPDRRLLAYAFRLGSGYNADLEAARSILREAISLYRNRLGSGSRYSTEFPYRSRTERTRRLAEVLVRLADLEKLTHVPHGIEYSDARRNKRAGSDAIDEAVAHYSELAIADPVRYLPNVVESSALKIHYYVAPTHGDAILEAWKKVAFGMEHAGAAATILTAAAYLHVSESRIPILRRSKGRSLLQEAIQLVDRDLLDGSSIEASEATLFCRLLMRHLLRRDNYWSLNVLELSYRDIAQNTDSDSQASRLAKRLEELARTHKTMNIR